ncbi:MAG: hypothetical protein FWF24_04535 [Alphaproteobacteria bacterium]|nr:hypothetical protein [Alphaproteobacteria bacterium]
MTDTHIINLKNVMRSWNLWIKKGPKETVKAFLDCAKDLYQKKATDNQIQAPAFIEAITDAYKTLDVEKQIELSTSLGFKWIWPINTQKDFDRNKANI